MGFFSRGGAKVEQRGSPDGVYCLGTLQLGLEDPLEMMGFALLVHGESMGLLQWTFSLGAVESLMGAMDAFMWLMMFARL